MDRISKFNEQFREFKRENKIDKNDRILGSGENGEVREIKIDGRIYAAKITEKKKGSFYSEKLKGPHIIKIYKIYEKKINNTDYNLIVMERAPLKDLGTMNSHLHEHNIFKLINCPFTEKVGENLLRYITKQIVKGLEVLERNELVHFNIKPENILIMPGLKLKLSDFSFLMNLKENKNKFKMPEGTAGYVTPEYFRKEEIDGDTAKKQDYFALGATLFMIKMGNQMLRYKKFDDDDKMTEDRIIDLLQRDIAEILSDPLIDKDFTSFLCNLIQYVPEERPSFEEIYRNKWLNKNEEGISLVLNSIIDGEEDKLMKELLKSDFLLEKQNELIDEKDNKESKKQKKSNFIFEL